MNNITDDFDNVKIPENIDYRIRVALMNVDKERNRKKYIFKSLKSLKYLAAVVGLVLIYGIGVNTSPVFASTTQKIPILAQLTQVLKIYSDKNIQNAANNGFGQMIGQSKTSNGVKLTIDSVIADKKKAIILYTIDVGNKNLTNLLIKDLKVTDKNNNLIVDSQKNFGRNEERKSNTSTGKDSFHLLDSAYFNKNQSHVSNFDMFNCEIMSTDTLNKGFSKTRQTKGLIEIKNLDQNVLIPDVLNLDFSKLDEAYPEPGNNLNENPNDYNYNKFIAKYNRKPISIDGDWKFSIKIDSNFKSASSTDFSNIKFSILNIQFNIDYLKIYPTTTDVKISYDSKDSKLVDRGVFLQNSYLEDDKGRKYTIGPGYATTAERAFYETYESPYFSNAKHLYFVVDEINIGEPDAGIASNVNYINKIQPPIKIKIK